ncbi:MAG: type II CAAX endopeptidase family protein [Urechidicola sp.]|nr:type II CAAX endopeptidase family protein [Urechidicola sp.]
MKKIFLTTTGRYRIIWRFILFIAVFMAISFPLQYGVRQVLEPSLTRSNIGMLIVTISMILSLYAQVKYFDKSSFKKYGLKVDKIWVKEFLFGCFIPLIQLSLFFGILYFSQNLTIVDYYVSSSSEHSFIYGFTSEIFRQLGVGIYEEILSRTFLFFIIYEMLKSFKMNAKTSVIISILFNSLLFGLMHIGNDNATWYTSLNISMDILTLCLPFLLTGRLGMSIGMHFAWNFIQSAVFGFANSGNSAKGALLSIDVSDHPITGGAFGPEGSSILLVLGAIAILLIYFWKRKHKIKRWIAPEFYEYGDY